MVPHQMRAATAEPAAAARLDRKNREVRVLGPLYPENTSVRSTTILLPYTGTYDWAAALRFFAARAVDGVEQVDGKVYRRTVRDR